MKVFINPGHALSGNPDPGAVNPDNGMRECDIAMTVGCLAADYLQKAGCEVTVLQSNNLIGESPEYPNIVATANASDADIFVSLHCNAANGDARGSEVEVYDNNGGEACVLAQCILEQIVTSLGTTDRGLKDRSGLAVLRGTSMPAVLVELAFIDNPDDAKLLANCQDDFARAVARGVTDYERKVMV